jgi:hypothetical protein
LVIYCDQDAAYQSKLLSELGRIMGTRMCFFSPYSHHNGLAEACNKTACTIIRSMVENKQIKEEQWSEVLLSVAYVMNITVNSETGLSPMAYATGKEPRQIAPTMMYETGQLI